MIAIFIPLGVSAFNPSFPIWMAIALGALVGGPLVVFGMRIHPNSDPEGEHSQSFWPTRKQGWGLLAFFVFFASVLIPFAIFAIGVFLLRKGDDWGIVILRLVFLVSIGLGAYCWFKFAAKRLPEWFRGKLSDELLDAFTREPPQESPTSVIDAATKNWRLVLVAAVALCISMGFVDLDSPWLNFEASTKRTRGFIALIRWCRGNPNTVWSSALLLGLGSLGLLAYRIWDVAKKNA